MAAILGAGIAAFRPPSPVVRNYIQHLAAGVVFSVVAVELLPDITSHPGAYLEVILGFGLGIGAMLALRSFNQQFEEHGSDKPIGLLVAVGIDILLDGFLIESLFPPDPREAFC